MTERKNPANDPSPAHQGGSILDWLRDMAGRGKSDGTLRQVLEEFGESANRTASVAAHEHALIDNVLKLRDLAVVDVMIPRADIVAIDVSTSQKDLLSLLAEKQFSRIPIFRETLDDIVGTIHVKDILACLAQGRAVSIPDLIREVPIVSPSMHVLDLILMMRQMRKHMALVVDEFGGIDGLVTIGDVIETIIGDIEDEHGSNDGDPQIIRNKDGSLLADARADIEDLLDICGPILTEDEQEEADTVGGLIFAAAGRIPGRGEVVKHPSGMIFEVIDADPRKINKVVIRNIPRPAVEE